MQRPSWRERPSNSCSVSMGATGANLKQEIDDLADRGILPPIMKEWAHELRELANDSAHPKPGQPATDPKDARDIVNFLDFLLDVVYNLPHRIEQFRNRPAPRS